MTRISDDSTFQAEIYLQVKRIVAGEVENTFIHYVNGLEISSNTVKTTTPEPVEPDSPTPDVPQTNPFTPTPPQNPVIANSLPQTGEASSLLGLIGGGLLLGLAYGSLRKNKKVENEEESYG